MAEWNWRRYRFRFQSIVRANAIVGKMDAIGQANAMRNYLAKPSEYVGLWNGNQTEPN